MSPQLIVFSFTSLLCLAIIVVFHKNFPLNRILMKEQMQQADQSLFNEYRNCLLRGMRSASFEQVWLTATNLVKQCENKTGVLILLPLVQLQNRDETKFVLEAPPQLEVGEDCNVVTLGIGKDIGAEQALSTLVYPLCHFYGSDPGIEENMELYSRIGKFYPFAVAATNGTRTASILDDKTGQYKDVNISHIDLISFLRDQVKLKVIDYLLMDVEYAEYDMLPFFLPGGLLDQNNITVCQWTCEFHGPNGAAYKRQFADFLWENVLSGRYLPMNFINVGHIRTTWINYQDELCVRRYIRQRRAGNS